MSYSDEPWPTLTGLGAARLKASGERIVVMGAGGWLGQATLEALHRLLGRAFHDRVVAYGSSGRALHLRGGLIVMQRPLDAITDLTPAPSLVLHLAFLTQEKAKRMSEEAYVAANRSISGAVLDALDRIGARAVFVASSGAVALAADPVAEASKRLYGALKLEDEDRFAAWARNGGGACVAARIYNVAGPYLTTGGAYALAAFIDDALAGRDISIKARRPVYRSYVAINELMSVVFGLLTEPGAGATLFDTAGDAVLEMDDIARTVAAEIAPRARIVRPQLSDDAEDLYVGDGRTYQAHRHRFDVEGVDFPAQVRQTANFMALAPQSR